MTTASPPGEDRGPLPVMQEGESGEEFSCPDIHGGHGYLEALEKIFLKPPLEPLVPLEAQNFSL